MSKCGECGALNRPGPSTCEQCGARLVVARRFSVRRIVSLVVSTLALVILAASLRQAGFRWSGGTRGFSLFELVLFAFTWLVVIRLTPHMEKTMVQVYYFTKYDITTDQKTRSRRPATLETITRVDGEPLLLTGVEVDESQLDAEGFLEEAN